MIKILIVDDELLAIRRLEIKLSRISGVTVVGRCQDGDAAMLAIFNKRPDLVLLDINMPGANGFDVAAKAAEQNVHVIFVTAFNQYAVQAFEKQVIDYLLKPVSANRLELAIERFRTAQQQDNALAKIGELNSVIAQLRAHSQISETNLPAKSLWIKDRGRSKKIFMDNIEWVEASRDYVSIHMVDGHIHFIRDTMAHFEQLLDPTLFQRVHRSAIVNFAQLKEIHNNKGIQILHLRSGATMRIGRRYKSATNLRLKEFAVTGTH